MRRENRCNIPVIELKKISQAAHRRTDKSRKYRKAYYKNNMENIDFYRSPGLHTYFHERIRYNYATGNITYTSRFYGINGWKLPVIRIS